MESPSKGAYYFRLGLIPRDFASVLGKEEERAMFQQMQAMAQKQVLIPVVTIKRWFVLSG